MVFDGRLLTGGRIWDGAGFVQASVLLEGRRIAQLIPEGSALPQLPPSQVLELNGAAVLPGFVDAHAHPLIGGTELSGVPLRAAASLEEALELVAEYARANPHLPWIVGEGFDLSLDRSGEYFAADLDRVVPDRPVALRSSDIHTMWANTLALRAAGITRDFPDPPDGVIERDEAGEPTGTLREWGAFMPLYRALPKRPPSETADALLRGLASLRAEGVTSVQDAWVELDDLEGYILAAERGLPVRLNLAFRADPQEWRTQLTEFQRARERTAAVGSSNLTARTVKFFADGIIEGGTAHVSRPYSGTSCCGVPAWPHDELDRAVKSFDAAGFQTHIHAIGDAALTTAVSAIEGAIQRNAHWDRRPVIAHAQLVARNDLERLRQSDITVAIQPYWAKLDDIVRHLTNDRLEGERQHRQYPFESMRRAGVRLASSSDYPITTGSALRAIAVAMSRSDSGDAAQAWIPEERMSFRSALDAATVAAAHTQFGEARLGRVETDFAADLTIVRGLPDAPDAADLLSAEVAFTIFDGEVMPPRVASTPRTIPPTTSLEGE